MTATTNPELEVDGRIEHGRIVMEKPPALPEGTLLHMRITIREPKQPRRLPQEFFDLTAGQAPDLERAPQGEYEIREPLA